MSDLNIPEEHRSAMISLATMPDEAVAALKEILSKASEQASSRDLATLAAKTTELATEKQFHEVIRALRSLQVVRSSSEVQAEEFADDVTSALEELDTEPLGEQTVTRFRQRIGSLLAIDPFAVHAKALGLQQDDERTFCRVRILTDVRPVFSEEVGDGVKGAVIVHLLKLGYHQSGQAHTDFYVSLDSVDLQTLKEAITRAELKAEAIRKTFSTVRYLGL